MSHRLTLSEAQIRIEEEERPTIVLRRCKVNRLSHPMMHCKVFRLPLSGLSNNIELPVVSILTRRKRQGEWVKEEMGCQVRLPWNQGGGVLTWMVNTVASL